MILRNRSVVAFGSIMVFLPAICFAFSLRPGPASLVLFGCFAALALIVGGPGGDSIMEGPLHIKRYLLCVGAALAIFLLGGETHLFYANADWLIRDAVLADLVRQGATAVYRVNDVEWMLRAPLGMYMLPALVGEAFGLFAAHVALLVQNTLFLACIFYLLILVGRGWSQLGLVLLFAGLSVLGAVLMQCFSRGSLVPKILFYGLDSWLPAFQYSGSIVQFFWVPNHALPGWWLATLLILQKRRMVDVAAIGVSVAGLSFWSPLAVIPAVPLLAYAAIVAWRPVLVCRRTWAGVGVALCFIPVVIYLVTGSATIAHHGVASQPEFLFSYVLFLTVQLPALAFLLVKWRDAPHDLRALALASGVSLCALPLFHFGPNNDLVMRGSITPLMIVGYTFAAVVVDLWATRRQRRTGGLAIVVGVTIVAIGSCSAIVEIGRAAIMPRYEISDCSLVEASQDLGETEMPANYTVRRTDVPSWLIKSDAAPQSRASENNDASDNPLPSPSAERVLDRPHPATPTLGATPRQRGCWPGYEIPQL